MTGFRFWANCPFKLWCVNNLLHACLWVCSAVIRPCEWVTALTADRLVWCFNTVLTVCGLRVGFFSWKHVGCDILLKAFFVIALWNAPLFDAGEIRPNPAMLAGGGEHLWVCWNNRGLFIRACVPCVRRPDRGPAASAPFTERDTKMRRMWNCPQWTTSLTAHYWVQLTDLKHAYDAFCIWMGHESNTRQKFTRLEK